MVNAGWSKTPDLEPEYRLGGEGPTVIALLGEPILSAPVSQQRTPVSLRVDQDPICHAD
jgi:hypothetical protein